jgi:hypothetical protein
MNGATWAAGKYGNALSFNGSNAYVDLGTPASLQAGGSMSWSAWIYATGVPYDDGQIAARSDDNTGWQFKTSPDTGVRTFGVAVTSSGASRAQRYSKTVVSLNTWYHVAGVYNASAQALDIYVNGVLDNGTLAGAVPATQAVPTMSTTVGRRSGGYYFQGLIDNLRIYTRALSAGDVQNDMNTAIGGTTPPPAQATVSALQCSPTSVAAGASSTCSVTLSAAAPSGGAAVALSDNSAALTVPASVTVSSGATTATFSAAAGSVTTNQAVMVMASFNGSTASAALTVVAPTVTPATVSGLMCTPSSLASGASATCTVSLSKAAPTGGATVAVADGCSTLTVPASVTVPAGATSATFAANAGSVTTTHTDVVTATLNGSTVTASITHQASTSSTGTLSALTCTPSILGSGASATCTVTLSQAAPSGGAAVKITDNCSKLSVPASVTVASGATSATFTAKASRTLKTHTDVITATWNGSTVTASVTHRR